MSSDIPTELEFIQVTEYLINKEAQGTITLNELKTLHKACIMIGKIWLKQLQQSKQSQDKNDE